MIKKAILLLLSIQPRLIVANEAEALTLDSARGMLTELLALPTAANDAAIAAAHLAAKPTLTAANERRTAALTALGLKPEATAEEMHAAILALPAQISLARTAAENAQRAEFGARLDIAINEGRVLQSQRATFETAYKADAKAANDQLAGAKTRLLNTTNKVAGLGDQKQVIANAAERQTQILTAVNERMRTRQESYDEAYAAVKADPALKALFEAQTQPAHLQAQAAA